MSSRTSTTPPAFARTPGAGHCAQYGTTIRSFRVVYLQNDEVVDEVISPRRDQSVRQLMAQKGIALDECIVKPIL